MKHTPGPWIVKNKNVVTNSDFNFVCSEANARLIAAAPEMLELLEEIKKEAIQNADSCDHELVSKIDAVLKKAKKVNN